MKRGMAVLIAVAALMLPGCSTEPRGDRWEYKVIRLARGGDANHSESPEGVREAQERLLNDLGKNGWVLVSQTDGRLFYFKRAVR